MRGTRWLVALVFELLAGCGASIDRRLGEDAAESRILELGLFEAEGQTDPGARLYLLWRGPSCRRSKPAEGAPVCQDQRQRLAGQCGPATETILVPRQSQRSHLDSLCLHFRCFLEEGGSCLSGLMETSHLRHTTGSIVCSTVKGSVLKRNPRAELNLPTWRGGFGDRAELRCIDKAVWRSEIDVIQGVEKLRAKLEPKSFTQSELARDCHVERLQSRSVDRISPHISKREGCRCSESRWIKPLGRSVSARPDDGLARVVGADWVFAQNRT